MLRLVWFQMFVVGLPRWSPVVVKWLEVMTTNADQWEDR
jgi:hypothetical protein